MNPINPNEDINPNANEIAALEAQIQGINIDNLDPMDNGKIKNPVTPTEETPTTVVQETIQETIVEDKPSEDPIKAELERVKGQTNGKTPKEKFEYKLKTQIAQAKEMGIDIADLVGVKQDQEEPASEEDKPLTMKDLQQFLGSQKTLTKTALEMAMEIQNEAERELHLYYLDNVIKPSGNPEQDFQVAKTMVNGIKLQNQVKLNDVKPPVQNHSTGSSVQPLKPQTFDNVKLTAEEEMLYRDAQIRGVTITKEEIIKMRG